MSLTDKDQVPGVPDAGRILVVDDDRDFADTVVHLLRLDGFEVETAHSMAAARQALERFAPLVALVDIRMGDGSGLDLAAEIRTAYPDVSCVMMTAYASVDTAVTALQEGANDYLRKPFFTRDLLSTIRRCIERNALVQERDRAEAALRERNSELEALNARLESLVETMRTLSGSQTIRDLCDALAKQAVTLAGAERSTVSLALKDGDLIEASAGDDEAGLPGRAAAPSGNPEEQPVAAAFADSIGQGLEMPLLRDDQQPMGALRVDGASGQILTLQDRDLLEILASHASEAVHRLQALERVSWSEARMRDIIDNSPSMIALQDLDGRFLLVNKQFEEWHGLPGDASVGRMASEVLTGETAELFDGEPIGHGERHREVCLTLADGAAHTLSLTRFPVHAPDGRLSSVGTIATDVTERRLAEQQLRQAQKMEALGQLTGGVAHDFNNILAVIAGNLSLARPETAGMGDLAEIVEDAFEAAQTGAELTNRLLAFGRLQALQPQRVDSRDLVTKMSRVLTRTLGETVELVARADDDLWPIQVDPSQLETCLLNLALNGRDAMADGGILRITAENAEFDDSGTPGTDTEKSGQYVLFTVADTGTGMDDDVIGRAVQPFFTTKRSGHGSGLGLSMVDGFVEQSGGRLEISSTPGIGTTVRVYLPRCLDRTRAPAPVDASAPDRGGQGERILIVEDQPKVRRLADRMLTRLGYRVLQSESAIDALDVLDDATDIDLLFTDVVLPGGMSGVELADEARRRRPGLKVLYTSGYAPELVLDKDHADQRTMLVRKPFQSEDLAQSIRHALDQPGQA